MPGDPADLQQQSFIEWLESWRSQARGITPGPDTWKQLGESGLFSLPVPKELGGAGLGYTATCQALATAAEVAGRSGLWFSVGAHLWACQEPIIAFGTAAQQQRLLPGMLAGTTIGAHAATEADAGSDILALRTTAKATGHGNWLLNGAKTFVTNGPVADMFLVLARTDAGSSIGSLTAFLVPRHSPGLTIGLTLDTLGLAGSELCSIDLRDCEVPERDCLGGVGGGFAVLMHTMRIERAFILAPALGLMDRALGEALTHVRTRRQFGKALGSFDSIRRRLVDMNLNLATAKDLLAGTASMADADMLDHPRASMTKLHLSRVFNAFCDDLADIYGGYAVLPSTGASRLRADALASRYYSGTSDIQINIIAEGMGL